MTREEYEPDEVFDYLGLDLEELNSKIYYLQKEEDDD